jgi:hypothetical protein
MSLILVKVDSYVEKRNLCIDLNYKGYRKECIVPPFTPNKRSEGEVSPVVTFWIDTETGVYEFNSKPEYIPDGDTIEFSEYDLDNIPTYKEKDA